MFDELLSKEVAVAIFAGFIALIVGKRLLRGTKRDKLPPGPIGLPLVGYLPFLTSKPHVKLYELSKKYGPVYRIQLGSQTVVVLCDYATIREAFNQDAMIGRPPDSFFEMNKGTLEVGAIHHLPWKEQRRFALHLLRDLGMGKSHTEEHIREEIEELLERLGKEKGKPVPVSRFLASSTSNNVSSFLFGKRRNYKDPKRIMLDDRIRSVGLLFRKYAWLSFFPLLKSIVSFLRIGKLKYYFKANDDLKEYIRDEIKEHKESFDPGNIKDFIDGYLLEIENTKNNPHSSFKLPVLEDLVGAFFGGGSETIRSAVEWLLLISVAYPEVEKKIQQEIDEVIGRERFPYRSDSSKMPYTEAVLLETLRWKAFLPINLPRCTIEDTRVNSFFIPKHTQVIAVNWSVHYDPKLWGNDVESFKPERFLSADGKEIRKPEYYMPFSVGKRSCPGESLAYVELFMYFVAILQRFRLRLPDGVKPDLEEVVGIGLQAKPYQLKFEPRT